jgi:hypothetical protein
MYFPHRNFVSDVSEIPISFPFPELSFPILFPIKNMETVMVLVFTDRFRPFSSLLARDQEIDCTHFHIIMILVGGQQSMGIGCLREGKWNKD